MDCFITAFDLNEHVRPPKQLWLQQGCPHWPRPRPGKLACQKRYGTVFQCYLIDFQKSRPFTTLSPCSASRTTAALIVLKIGLCQSPLATCRLPLTTCCLLLLVCSLALISAIFCCRRLVVVTVLFSYNYLFNHNFVRVSTIINHQMHLADSGRQNSVTGPTVSLTDWPLSARAANRKPEKEMKRGAARSGQAVWNALHAPASAFTAPAV